MRTMAEILLQIRVFDHSGPIAKDAWWVRVIDVGFLPEAGDSVQLWGDNDGPLAPVKQRWWRPDGCVCVELVPIVLNSDTGQNAMKDGRLQWVPQHRKSRDLTRLLLEAGWQEAL